MNRTFLFLLSLLCASNLFAQEIDCEIVVNAQQTGDANNSVFQVLEQSLEEFVNQTSWTNRNFQEQEKIKCSMFLNITNFDGNSFSGSIQVQSSRPVFGATLQTPVFSFNDENFSFEYTEYENLLHNPNEYRSNLASVVTFYIYTILGMDADTFKEEGGTSYYQEASRIVSTAQQSNKTGWSPNDGRQSRYRLNADLLSNTFRGYRLALYTYHRQGLDLMHRSPKEGKEGVRESILQLEELNRGRPGSLLLRTFFDAKANEIEKVFSGGPSVSIKEVVDALNKMAPTFADNWSNISY